MLSDVAMVRKYLLGIFIIYNVIIEVFPAIVQILVSFIFR